MKILRVIASMDPATGGPCQGIRYSIPYLQSEGCLNEVVCLDDPEAAFLNKDPFPVHALGRGKGPLRYHSSLLKWLEANLHSYDSVIVHGLWLWPSIATWIAIRKLRRKGCRLVIPSYTSASASLTPSSQLPAPKTPPYFVMPHGMLDPWFQHEPGRRWKALRNRIYWRWIEHRVIRDAAAVLFTCQRELELARTTFPLYSPNREINIGYGVPDSPVHTEEMDRAFHESCPGLHYERPFLLFLSRIHPKKGIDLLIRAYAEVFGDLSKAKRDKPADVTSQLTAPNSQLPEPFAFSQSSISDTPFPINHVPALVIAGPVDSDYAREMIRLAECLLPGLVVSPRLPSVTRLPIPDHPCPINRPAIHFSGMLQGDAKWGALYRCEVFVLPSHQENFGISIAEALSCSKPVLISRQVNIAPEIQSDRAGFVGPGNLEGVASLLRRWKESQPLERSVLVRSAYACFVSRFGVASAAQRLWVALRSGSPNNSITQNLS